MKKIILSLLGIAILFVCCEKDNNIVDTLEVIDQKITPSYQSVSVQCLLSTKATISESYVQLSTTSDFSKYDSKVMKKDSNGWYVAEVQGLKENTEYYFRYQAENNYSSFLSQYGEKVSFTTKSYLSPTVVTTSASNITYTSASVGGNVTSDGGKTITERGVVYSTSNNPTTSNTKKVAGKGTGEYSVELSDLSDGTTYYVRAYAINSKGTAYGEQVSFTTKGYSLPTVVTTSASNITYTSASVGGDITSDGNSAVTERGVVYSTSSNPTTSNTKKVSGSGTGTYSVELSGLSEGTKYYVRAYAINSKGTAYGEEVSFTTQGYSLPTVVTLSASNISSTSASVGGNVTSDGNSAVTERGVVYSTSSNPTTSNTKKVSGKGTGSYSVELSNLSEGTTYYVRAYAINSKGTAYGEEVSFTTNKYIVFPTVTTTPATQVTTTTAVTGGNVTADGNATVTERGVVYSTSQAPTTNGITSTKMISGSGTGSFTCNLRNLSEGTTYYVRAYAINSRGIAYGEEKSFTTLKNSSSDPTIKVVTVQQFINASESTEIYYELTGVIGGPINTTYGNFDLTDETGTIYVWGVTKSFIALGSTANDQSFASLGLEEGDKITIRGFRSSNKYNGNPEVHGAYFVKLVSKGDGGNTETQPKTIVFDADVDQGDAGTDSNNATSYTITKDGVTITVSNGIIGTYNNEDHYRVYKNQTLTVSTTSGSIKSVEFTCTANGNEKYGPGGFTWSIGNYSYSGAVGTWTGSASEVVFTASSNQVRATEIEVVVESSESSESSTAKVRFQKTDAYSRVPAMYLYDETETYILAKYRFGESAGISSYFEIPSGYAYPLFSYIEDLDTMEEEKYLYYMLDDPYYYYFEAGCKYTLQVSDDGNQLTFNVIKDGTFNLPAKVVATYKVHKNELRMQKKVKIE